MTETLLDFDDFDEPERQVRFRLGGETFDCVWPMPYGQFEDMMRAFIEDSDVLAAQQQLDFFGTVIVEEDQERWRKLIRDPARRISAQRIQKVMEGLLDVYMGRPTSEGSGSSGSPSPTGNGSTAASASPGSDGDDFPSTGI